MLREQEAGTRTEEMCRRRRISSATFYKLIYVVGLSVESRKYWGVWAPSAGASRRLDHSEITVTRANLSFVSVA